MVYYWKPFGEKKIPIAKDEFRLRLLAIFGMDKVNKVEELAERKAKMKFKARVAFLYALPGGMF
jgi:hypothetical protein